MEEISINEYIRTDKGNIGKLVRIRKCSDKEINELIDVYFLDNGLWTIKKYIVNHSKNIIDLIEVGDYVNGKEVYSIGTSIGDFPIISYKDGTFDIDTNIKSIVTKEQYKSVEYQF